MKRKILVGTMSIVLFMGCSRDRENIDVVIPQVHKTHWDYENPDWASQGYSECAGMIQSPIDIQTNNTFRVKNNLLTKIDYSEIPIKVIDNGHTVQVNTERGSIEYGGEIYNLKQFHFHGSSEHYIDGQSQPLEVHFVHENTKTKALVVLGVFVKGGAAKDNEAFVKYLQTFPVEKNKEISSPELLNPVGMLPVSKLYYNYTGSLTTPPCSQGLSWIVFKEVVSISDVQLKGFLAKYHHNARPVQKKGSRVVYELE